MAKRNWPGHIGIGRRITYNGKPVTVVDVKAGPMMVDTSKFDQPDVEIEGTLKLKVLHEGGAEEWTPPLNGNQFVKWCEQKDAEAK